MQVLVSNVAPTIDLPSATEVLEGSPFDLVLGEITDPVNAPQMRKIDRTEMTDAARFGRTALSSPKVTVLREVKSWRDSRIELNAFTATKATTKIAI